MGQAPGCSLGNRTHGSPPPPDLPALGEPSDITLGSMAFSPQGMGSPEA